MAAQEQNKVPDLVPINGSTNVYVGQRYVPKFYDDGTEQHGATWDKTKVYEPLTIVLWQGDSYTSRTFVPARVEITDTQYWLQTGVFNAQLESYKDQLNDTSNIANANYKRLNRRFIVFGDSYADPATPWSYGNYLKNNLNLTESGQFYNFAVGGAAYTGQPNTYLAQLMTAMGQVKDPDTITDILVIGGHNEISSLETITVAMNSFYDNASGFFKNARIYSVFAGVNTTNAEKRLQLYTTKLAYASSIRPFANIDCSYILYTNKTYMNVDGVHPSNVGTMWACRAITSVINGGSDDITMRGTITYNMNSGITNSTTFFNVAFNSDIAIIYCDETNITFPNRSGATWFEIATITSTLGLGLPLNQANVPLDRCVLNVPGFVVLADNSTAPATVKLGFANGKLYLKVMGGFTGSYKGVSFYGLNQPIHTMFLN